MGLTVDGGFVWPGAFHTMEFDEVLAGLWIRVRGLSGAGTVELVELDVDPDKPLPAAGLFMAQVDSWNLRFEDGRTTRLSLDGPGGLMDHDVWLIRQLVGAWVREVLPRPHPEVARAAAGLAAAAPGLESPGDPLEDDEVDLSGFEPHVQVIRDPTRATGVLVDVAASGVVTEPES